MKVFIFQPARFSVWGRKDFTVDDLRLVTIKVKDETIVQTGARVKHEQDKT